jgi:uncharacterized membrane protein
MKINYSSSIINIVQLLHQQLGVNFTKKSIEYDLETHPDFPSLNSITSVLQERNIDNVAANVNADQLLSFDTPILLIPTNNYSEPSVATKIDSKYITQQYSNKRIEVKKINDFKNEWSGAVVLVSKNETSGEKNYNDNLKREVVKKNTNYLLTALAIIIISGITFLLDDLQVSLFVLNCICGLVLCVMLSVNDIQTNSVISKICKVGRNTDCNSVLKSPAAKLFGWLKVSDAAIIYFSTAISSAIILNHTNSNYLPLFAFICTISLPYTLFSLIYQYKVIKQWCPLCLGVQGVLWINFFILNSYLNLSQLAINTEIAIRIGWSLCFSMLIWIFINKQLITSSKVKPLILQLGKLRRDPFIFESLLKSQQNTIFHGLDKDISVGLADAPIQIVVVTDPACLPCRSAHKFLEYIQKEYNNTINLSCILQIKDIDNIGYYVSKTVLSLPVQLRHEALRDWFDTFDYNMWKNKYKDYGNEQEEILLNTHIDWCRYNEIEKTPTIYLNGKKVPEMYSLHNLAYHIKTSYEEVLIK